jgi:aminopeptidase N
VYFVPEKKDGKKIVHSEQIWTQGEPDEARFWFPAYDFPDDKATSELLITARSDEDVISNGELVEKKENGDGTAVFHYKMAVTHSSYMTSFVIGKYSKTADVYKNIPLGIYVYPGEESVIPLAFSDTKEMFRIFEEVTGVNYQFNKYDQTIVDNFVFGGMENITATTFSDKEIFLARFAHLRGFTLDLVSHERAHSWFGNLVTCRNWAELWLNEGFATYMEAVFRGKMYGKGAYAAKIREDANIYLYGDAVNNYKHGLFNLTANRTDRLFKYPNITYNKGSLVIHLLRENVGEEAFWKAVNIYLNRYKYSNVETTDLKKAMEEVSGKNLDTFFKQWVYGIGHPKLEIEPVYNSQTKTLNLTISQTQKGERVPEVFNFPMEIFIKTESGERIERVLIDNKTQTFSFNSDEKPLDIILDKNTKMPLFEAKINKIKIH